MSKHTPGPWDYDCDSGGCYFKLSAGEEAIIDCCDFCSTPTINTEANASLIAAAPEMLDALKVFLEYNDQGGPLSFNTDEMWAQARAAVAKAEGKVMP